MRLRRAERGLGPVGLVYALLFAMAAQFTAMVPLAPVFAARMDLSKVETGALFTATGVAIMAAAVPIGLLADRVGARAVTLSGASLLVVSALGQGLAPGLWSLLGARAVFGLGFAAILSAAPVWLADSVELGRQPMALGAVMPVAGIGGLVSPVVSGFLADRVGLSAPFLLVAGFTFCVLVGLGAARRSDRSLPPPQPLLVTARALGTERLVLGSIVAMGLAGLTETSVNLLAPLQLRANGSSLAFIGLLLSISSAVFTLIGISVARVVHRTARLEMGGVAAVLMGGAIVPLVVSTSTATVASSVISRTAVSAVLFTIAFPLGALGAARAGLGQGAVNGLLTLTVGTVNAVGPLMAGGIAQAATGRWAYALLVVLSLAAAAWLLAPRRTTAPGRVDPSSSHDDESGRGGGSSATEWS